MTFTSHGFAWGLLHEDRVTDYILLLLTAANHAYSRGFWTAPESTTIDRSVSSTRYCTPSQGLLPLMLKWALLFEDWLRQQVWIGKALPRDYLQDGLTVQVSNATFSHGSASFVYSSSIANARTITVQLYVNATVFPKNGLMLRVRAPKRRLMRSVTLNGEKFTNFNAFEEYIVVPSSPGDFLFVVSY